MFDRITYISNDGCDVKLKSGVDIAQNLMNMHLIFEDGDFFLKLLFVVF